MKLIEFFRRLFRRKKAQPAPEALPTAEPEQINEAEPAPAEAAACESAPVETAEVKAEETVETAEEPVAESEPEKEPEPQAEVLSETAQEQSDKRIIKRVIFVPSNRLVNVRYDKSFTAKLIQTNDVNKAYYNELKNELLSYKKVHSRISWRQDSFRMGRDTVARIAVRGKTLCLYLALDPRQYEGTKYIVEDVSDVKKNEDTPCLYRIKNDRRLRYAKALIAQVLQSAVKLDTEPVDYAKDYPYEKDEPLLERGLIKLVEERNKLIEEELPGGELELEVPREVTVATAEELLKDEIAEVLVRESENVSVRGKQTIVNVDTLDEYFEDGETVTHEKMRERIPFLNTKATYVKVLARGSISKSLEVEADDFSLAAIKMIILAGGNVYRKRSS